MTRLLLQLVVVVTALTLAGAFGLALLRRPQRGLLLLALLVPFDGLLEIGDVPTTVKAWKEALLVATVVAAMIAPSSRRTPLSSVRTGWVPAIVGLVGLGFVSAATIGSLQAAVGLKVAFFTALVVVVLWRQPLTSQDRDHLVTILMVVGIVVSVVGLGQQVVGHERLAEIGFRYNETIRFAGGFLRSFSTFNQPFPFALYLMMVLLVCGSVALSAPRRTRNMVFLVSTPMITLAMLSAIVRGAILGLVIGGLYLAVRRYRMLFALVPLGVAGLLLLPTSASGAFFSSSSFDDRTVAWTSNLGKLAEPLGNGIGASGAAAERTQFEELGREELLERAQAAPTLFIPDNQYVKTAYDLGPIGLWLLVLLFIAAFLCTDLRAPPARDPDAALATGVAAFVLAAAAASTVATYFEIFPMDLYFWLLVGAVTLADDFAVGPMVGTETSAATRAPRGGDPQWTSR